MSEARAIEPRWEPADQHAYAFAQQLIAMTKDAYQEIGSMMYGDPRGARVRQLAWEEAVHQGCADFNKHMAAVVKHQEKMILDYVRSTVHTPFVPRPENE